jgi:SnoaL-like domain
MHRPIIESLVRSCMSVAASVVLISCAAVTPAAAAESFTPTMKDMLSIQGAIERYLKGMDTRDVKLEETAFWDDAVIISPQGPQGPPVKTSFKQILAPLQMPPQGGASGSAIQPTCDTKAEKPAKGWDLWHIVANSSFEFLSPTRVKHHAYWFTVCPSAGTANGAGLAVIGPPGSYNDILEKRNGEWRFIERNIALNEKYAGM